MVHCGKLLELQLLYVYSSWSLESTCPENSSSWEYLNGTAWVSGGGGEVDVACCSVSCEDDFARADNYDYIKRLLLMLLLCMPGVLYFARYIFLLLCGCPYIAYALMRMLYECYAGVRAAGYAML